MDIERLVLSDPSGLGAKNDVMDKMNSLVEQVSESAARITNECVMSLINLTGEKVDIDTSPEEIQNVVNRMYDKGLEIKIEHSPTQEIIIKLNSNGSMLAGYIYKTTFTEDYEINMTLIPIGIIKEEG